MDNPVVYGGSATFQGERLYQEDRLVVKDSLLVGGPKYVEEDVEEEEVSKKRTLKDTEEFQADGQEGHHIGFYAVFDGHNGDGCSRFLEERMDIAVSEMWEEVSDGLGKGGMGSAAAWPGVRRMAREALINAFVLTDETYIAQQDSLEEDGDPGSTAAVAVVDGSGLHVACTGDSTAWLVRAGEEDLDLILPPHKPDDPYELERITESGGIVVMPGDEEEDEGDVARATRADFLGLSIMGVDVPFLAVSRAFGDSMLKDVPISVRKKKKEEEETEVITGDVITAEPDVMSIPLRKGEHLAAVLVSDGVTDVLESREICAIVNKVLQTCRRGPQMVASRAARDIINASKKAKTVDNASAVVLVFEWPEKEETKRRKVKKGKSKK